MASAELFEDPFDPVEYVERLAWRTPGGGTKGGAQGFNPQQLHDEFVAHITELKNLDTRIQRKVERLETTLQREARAHVEKVADLQKSHQVAFSHFQSLDDRINYVATKVVHLGDQLEGVNTPRAHAAEALKLMKYFDEFLSDEFTSEAFVNPYRVHDAADIVHKLHLIAQELPYDRFAPVKASIVSKYHTIESELLNEFREAHKNNEVAKMKELASTLSHFKGYQYCIDAFIEESIQNSFYNRNEIFSEVGNLCAKVHKVILSVFSSPEQVMGKLVAKIYQTKLSEHVSGKLREHRSTDPEKYLQHLHKLYGQTVELSGKLSQYKLGSDSNFLNKLTKSIFKTFLQTYIEVEESFLKEKAMLISQRFYDSKNHTKKQLHTGIQDLKAVISDKTSIRFGLGSSSTDSNTRETYLSQELAINLLQETKMGFGRCKTLSSQSKLAANATRIFNLLLEFLCKQHIEYAIDLGLMAVPPSDPKTEPNIYFLDIVQQTNTVFHLFEKQFADPLLPLVSASPSYSECVQRKKKVRERMEVQLDTGIDKCLSSVIGWMRHIMRTEQKKSDFSTDQPPQQQYTNACQMLCKYVKKVIDTMRTSLDGNNVDAVLKEFGTRYHRLVYDHLQQYSFSSMGGMMAICDVNEYGKCAQQLQVPFVNSLFESLHSLCNLLVVAPENLRQVCSGDQFANLDRAVLHTFVQLRSDYRSARLAKHFS
uniref:exocyst complex component 5 n=1 Tax=Ciona intestinalis TaxID=7719 RepID=UPI000180C0AD|nr:exocyst complex component 5 [Ciona intestinalis]|eukprot:XP_002125790.1 exocyst complex component 5 [Ciona intestinalis]